MSVSAFTAQNGEGQFEQNSCCIVLEGRMNQAAGVWSPPPKRYFQTERKCQPSHQGKIGRDASRRGVEPGAWVDLRELYPNSEAGSRPAKLVLYDRAEKDSPGCPKQ